MTYITLQKVLSSLTLYMMWSLAHKVTLTWYLISFIKLSIFCLFRCIFYQLLNSYPGKAGLLFPLLLCCLAVCANNWVHNGLKVATKYSMMTSSNGNIFRFTGPLWGEFTGHRWIPLTKASDVGLWGFLWPVPEKRLSKQSRRRWFGQHRISGDDICCLQLLTVSIRGSPSDVQHFRFKS